MTRLLGSDSPRHGRSPKAGDLEEGGDKRPLLLGLPAKLDDFSFAGEDKHCCRKIISRWFGSAYNPQFADDAELAVRAAFFVVVVGLPFLIPRHEIPTLDYFMKKGVYTNSVVIFFIYNLGKTTGETILNVICGIRGTLLAVLNTWCMFYAFPGGVTETSPKYVMWAGVADGILFISAMLVLNWQTSTVIFAVSNFVFFWMSFLQPGDDDFHCPLTKDFVFLGNAGINSLITVAIGGFLCIMVTFVPYPRWAQLKAQETAEELVHRLPLLWKTLAEFFLDEAPNSYREDHIRRRLERLSRLTSTLDGHIANSWYECFGRKQWHHVRRILTALEKMINESYDRIYSTYTATSAETWGDRHDELARRIRPALMAAITEIEVLLKVCFECAFDGEFTVVEEKAMKKVMDSVRRCEEDFARAFRTAREELLKNEKEPEKSRLCMDELLPEHIFGLNFSSFVRSSLGFAEDLIQQRHDPNHLPRVNEIPSISSVWDKSVLTNATHLNWALRAAASIFSGFFIGYNGFSDLFSPYDASIACTASVLLSKFVGSAMVKNLGRIQGVVLGSIIGQIVHALFESCEPWSVTSLTVCLFLYAVATLFTYYHSTEYSYIACLLAGFGCGQMMAGGCGLHNLDKASGYDKMSTTVCATALIVLFDFVFSPGRASDFANTALGEAVDFLHTAISKHFDRTVVHVRFHKGDLHDMIARAEAMGAEAENEPRVWRTPWRGHVFTAVVQAAYRVRYSLAAMEYSMAEGFNDGGRKSEVMRMIQEKPECEKLVEVVKSKVSSVRGLVAIFAHETQQRFPGLDDPSALQEYRSDLQRARKELAAEVAKAHPMASQDATVARLEEDTVCQACVVLGSMGSILSGLRKFQHAVMRAE